MPATPVRDSGTRQNTFILRVTVDGKDWGVWDKKTGGDLDSDELKYLPGGMLPAVSLGGTKQAQNVTLQRLYDRVDDHDRINDLLNAVGKGKVVITQRPMTVDGVEYVGKRIMWTGTLKRCKDPDVDSESNTAALLEIEVTIAGYPNAV